MRRSLGALGEEGERIGLLRPVLAPREILFAKLGGGLAHSVGHAVLYATFLLLAGRVVGAGVPSPAWLLWGGVTLSLFLAGLGTGLGFLLPDFGHDLAALPGASAAGKALYLVVSGGIVALYVTGGYLIAVGKLSAPAWAGIVVLLGAIVLSGSAVIAWRGAARLDRIES
jgi:hypothetical protein